MKHSLALLTCLFLLCLLPGCVSVEPQADPTRFFVLGESRQTERLDERNEEDATLQPVTVGPISVPDYLKRKEIAVRVAPSRLEYLPYQRWAEPLESGIQRALVLAFEDEMPYREIATFPSLPDEALQLRIEVMRFEPQPDGNLLLEVRYSLEKRNEPRPSIREAQVSVPANADDAESIVSAMNAAIQELARQIIAGTPNLS